MIERTKRIEAYTEIRYHTYKGIDFFTAFYPEMKHFVLEPRYEEVFNALDTLGDISNYSEPFVWYDSSHSWADNMNNDQIRNQLIWYAHNDIDRLLNNNLLKELKTEYLEKRKRIKKALEALEKTRTEKR